MKKTVFFFIAILLGVSASGQFGDGRTPATAYYGAITAAKTWTNAYNGGNIYVGQSPANKADLIISNGGSLTIEAGLTIIFCTTETDLKIIGNGVLIAIGNSTTPITFTKLSSISSWGHISFEGSTGVSTISYGDVENGMKTGASIEGYGGGLHINSSSVTISNCHIHNNIALYGGGIFVNKAVNPAIINCQIFSNTATSAAGGLYCWNNSFSTVNNCLIYNNICTGSYGGGGVFLGPLVGNTLFYNCDIISNISTFNLGNNILFFGNTNANRPKFYNTIVWGGSNPINYSSGQSSSLSDFNNCAIQGYTTGYTSCITLSSTNGDPTGPNFIDPTNADYAISFASPCRDAGVSTGAPATDILGNGRVGNTDIGAYEAQYSTWTGATSTDWAIVTNWQSNVVPITGTSDVVIPSGLPIYPTGSPSQNFTIGTGRQLILHPGAQATLGTVINNGLLRLESDATGISSLIVSSYSGNDATVEIYLTGGNPGAPTLKLNKWHFISTPVALLPVNTFAPTYTLNVAGWYDNQVSGSLATGWIAYDGYRYSTGGMGGPTFSNLVPGMGYDFYAATDQKYTFAGQLNTGTYVMNLSFNTPPGNASLNGYNLLGNPFSSGLDWDYILNNTPFPANTSKSLYFTRDNAQCSYIGGVGIPSDVTGIIPPMQGFFVKAYATGGAITIPAAARVQGNIHPRYKGLEIIPLVRLQLAEGTVTDETVVRFDATAKSGFDYDFDAPKSFLSSDVLSIYSVSDGTDLAINGLPFPDPSVEIPIVVNLTTTGNHTITATQLQGLDNYDVTLTDLTSGFVADLKTTPTLTFTGVTGTTADRFVLKVVTITTGIETPLISNSTFNIFPANNMINIQTVSDKWDGKLGSVKVIDLTGRTIRELSDNEFSKNSLTRVPAPVSKGIYIVEIQSGTMRYVGKVVIK